MPCCWRRSGGTGHGSRSWASSIRTKPRTRWLFWRGTATGAGGNLVDDGGRLAIDFGVTGPPESYFIDAEGIVRFKQFGAVAAAVIDDELVPLLPAGK